MIAALESTVADPDGRAELRWELYDIAEDRPCRWMGEAPIALVESASGYERYVLASAIAASGHPRRAARYADLARRRSPFVGCAYAVLVTIPDVEILAQELLCIADAARRENVVGSLARRLLALVRAPRPHAPRGGRRRDVRSHPPRGVEAPHRPLRPDR